MTTAIQIQSAKKQYYPVIDLAFVLYGYKLNSATLSRWARGLNSDRKQLTTIKLGGKYHCTEADLIAFVESAKTPDKREPLKTNKAPSPAARAKRIANAQAELEAVGI